MPKRKISNIKNINLFGKDTNDSQILFFLETEKDADVNPGVELILNECKSPNGVVMTFEDFKSFILRSLTVLAEKDKLFKDLLDIEDEECENSHENFTDK